MSVKKTAWKIIKRCVLGGFLVIGALLALSIFYNPEILNEDNQKLYAAAEATLQNGENEISVKEMYPGDWDLICVTPDYFQPKDLIEKKLVPATFEGNPPYRAYVIEGYWVLTLLDEQSKKAHSIEFYRPKLESPISNFIECFEYRTATLTFSKAPKNHPGYNVQLKGLK